MGGSNCGTKTTSFTAARIFDVAIRRVGLAQDKGVGRCTVLLNLEDIGQNTPSVRAGLIEG